MVIHPFFFPAANEKTEDTAKGVSPYAKRETPVKERNERRSKAAPAERGPPIRYGVRSFFPLRLARIAPSGLGSLLKKQFICCQTKHTGFALPCQPDCGLRCAVHKRRGFRTRRAVSEARKRLVCAEQCPRVTPAAKACGCPRSAGPACPYPSATQGSCVRCCPPARTARRSWSGRSEQTPFAECLQKSRASGRR